MRTLLLTAAAIPALLIAAPAAAQYSQYSGPDYRTDSRGIDNRLIQLERRVDAGIRSGEISQREARMLRAEFNDVRRLYRSYSANGLTRDERRVLQDRIRDLHGEIRFADNGAYDRYERYGEWDDGRYSGQGGPYEEIDACESRTGISGIIDSVFGGTNCLRVGQRATGNLYGVPYQYRNQYRDGYGYYYRSDGRAIYQIDSRTNTVMRVHPLED